MKRFEGGTCGWLGRGGVTMTLPAPAALAALAPVVSSLVPAVGSFLGGLASVVNGSGFALGASVDVGGAPAVALVLSPETIAIVTPLGALGFVDVVVTNPDGQTSGTTGALKFRFTL